MPFTILTVASSFGTKHKTHKDHLDGLVDETDVCARMDVRH